MKLGVLGLGKVGRKTLQRMLHVERKYSVYWVSDSEFVISKESEPFTPQEIHAVIRAKARRESLSSCIKAIPHGRIDEFRSITEESQILKSIMVPRNDWVVLDTASLPSGNDYEILRNMMGISGLCSASKTPWADYKLSSELYHAAEKQETFLGLNCTTGVWVDQMESLPLIMERFAGGRIEICKRDNTSLNLFFTKVDSDRPPDLAIREIERAGHLEPGAKGLSMEVHDQILKAHITANMCCLLREIKPKFVEDSFSGRNQPRSMSAEDIARWHKEGVQRGLFRALVSKLVLEGNHSEHLMYTVSFSQLPEGSPLARNLLGRSAIFVESASLTGGESTSSPKHGFFHSGYGGAERTAAKLILEMEEITHLSRFRAKSAFHSLPILFAMELGQKSAVKLSQTISRCLS